MKNAKRRIEYFLYPGATGLDITGPLEVFSTATHLLEQRKEGHKGYSAVFSGAQPGPVRMSSGLHLHADLAVDAGDAPDVILLPGGTSAEQVIQNRELIARIREKASKAKQVVSVCNGAFILAACGFLKGKYVESMRLSRARELLESSSNSIAEIAEACGFTRDERLRRGFVRSFGITPSQYRIHFRSQQQ